MIGRLSSEGRLTAARSVVCLGILGLLACMVLGCSRAPESAVAPGGVGSPPQAKAPVTPADIKAAEDVTRAYWEALIAGKYDDATMKMEGMATLPDAQRKVFAGNVGAMMQKLKPTRIVSLGPARQDPSKPGTILVPYEIEAVEATSGEAIVRRLAPSQGWLISGGI
jgi:hypothetical protein